MCLQLAKILSAQQLDNLGDEIKELFKRSLANLIKNEGPWGVNAGVCHRFMGNYYWVSARKFTTFDKDEMEKQLLISKVHLSECLRINSRIYGPSHQLTTAAKEKISKISDCINSTFLRSDRDRQIRSRT